MVMFSVWPLAIAMCNTVWKQAEVTWLLSVCFLAMGAEDWVEAGGSHAADVLERHRPLSLHVLMLLQPSPSSLLLFILRPHLPVLFPSSFLLLPQLILPHFLWPALMLFSLLLQLTSPPIHLPCQVFLLPALVLVASGPQGTSSSMR